MATQLDGRQRLGGLGCIADDRCVSLLQHREKPVEVSQATVEAQHPSAKSCVVVLLCGTRIGVFRSIERFLAAKTEA